MKQKMSITTVKVSEKGQIAIPQSVRERMRIEKGDELVLFERDDTILIEKLEKVAEKVEDDLKDFRKLSMKALRNIWDNEEDEKWSRQLMNQKSSKKT